MKLGIYALLLSSCCLVQLASGPNAQAPPRREAGALLLEVRGEAGKSLAGAKVEVALVATEKDAGGSRAATTGEDGRASLKPLAPGRYRIAVTAPGYVERVDPTVLVPAGAEQRLRVDLLLGSSVEGRVVESSGKGIEGARVCIEAGDSLDVARVETKLGPLEHGKACATTDREGKVGFAPVPRGAYQAIVIAAGFAPLVQILELRKAQVAVEWSLKTGGAITGRVVDGDGKGVAKARVSAIDRLRPPAGGATTETLTDAEGRFILKALEARGNHRRWAHLGHNPDRPSRQGGSPTAGRCGGLVG
jgi:hypothetical protein